MSIDCHVYCGPYLACKFHLIEREVAPVSPEVIVCPRCGAAPRGSSFVAAKFCPACGSALENRPAPPARKMIPSVDFHDLRDFIDERLYVPFGNSTLDARMIERLTHYWLPNRSGDGVGVLLDPRRDMTESLIASATFAASSTIDTLRVEGWSFTGIFGPPEAAYLTPDGETLADHSEAAEYAHRVWLAGVKASRAFVLTWPRWRLRAIPGYSPECEIIIRGRTEAEAMARLCALMAWGDGLLVGAIFERMVDGDEG